MPKFQFGDTVRALVRRTNLGQTVLQNTIGVIDRVGVATGGIDFYVLYEHQLVTFRETELELVEANRSGTDEWIDDEEEVSTSSDIESRVRAKRDDMVRSIFS